MWNINSPTDITLRMSINGNDNSVLSLALSETTIISGSSDKTIKVHIQVYCN